MIRSLVFIAFAAGFLSSAAHAANGNGIVIEKQWGAMDKCARQAVDKFPDHTADDLTKRDAYTRKCQDRKSVV